MSKSPYVINLVKKYQHYSNDNLQCLSDDEQSIIRLERYIHNYNMKNMNFFQTFYKRLITIDDQKN